MCTVLSNKLCFSLSFSLPHPFSSSPSLSWQFCYLLPWIPHVLPFSLHHHHVLNLPWQPHKPFFPVMRGSSDTVCSPCSARLLLHSWSGLEVSHYSGVPPPHHRLLPWSSGPAEWLHRGMLWSPPRSRHGQVGDREKALQLCFQHFCVVQTCIRTLNFQTCVFFFLPPYWGLNSGRLHWAISPAFFIFFTLRHNLAKSLSCPDWAWIHNLPALFLYLRNFMMQELLFCFEIGSYYVAQGGLELTVILLTSASWVPRWRAYTNIPTFFFFKLCWYEQCLPIGCSHISCCNYFEY